MSLPGSTEPLSKAVHALTILAVRDLAVSAAFYDGLFGWEKTVDVPVYVEYALPGGQRIGLYDREGFARNVGELPHATPPGSIGGCELYLYCPRPEELLDRIPALGGRLLSPVAERDWGDTVGYGADPDGHVLALARMKQE